MKHINESIKDALQPNITFVNEARLGPDEKQVITEIEGAAIILQKFHKGSMSLTAASVAAAKVLSKFESLCDWFIEELVNNSVPSDRGNSTLTTLTSEDDVMNHPIFGDDDLSDDVLEELQRIRQKYKY